MTLEVRRDLSIATISQLPAGSTGPGADDDVYAFAARHGYQGMQVFYTEQAARVRDAGLVASAIAPARTPDEVRNIATYWADEQIESLTLHLGTGFENDAEADALCDAVTHATHRHQTPILVETHRATVFQDPARALSLLRRHPAISCTADLSHWYTGVELVYGDFESKFDALRPMFERVRMIHGRISDPGCIQVPIDESAFGPAPPTYVAHFGRFWTAILEAVADQPDAPGHLPFVIELLPASSYYARTASSGVPGHEVADRWQQADLHWAFMTSLQTTVLA